MRSNRYYLSWSARLVLAALMIVPLLLAAAAPAAAQGRAARGKGERSGAVYTLSNAPEGNQVLIYTRAASGALQFQQAVSTGGQGSGSGLGSQDAIILSRDGRRLFAVNAGSNQVSVFSVERDGLTLSGVFASGGEMPISLTSSGDLLYVLNAGGAGNITGFYVGKDGSLAPVPGSTQPLSNGGAGAAPGPAQVSFSPDGRALVVTEKATNLILVYAVHDGAASAPSAHLSAGMTPFGFSFNKRGYLIVSEAFGGEPGISATSSYRLEGQNLALISPSAGAGQTAACWVAISKNGKYAYVTNTGSSTITSLRIGKKGSLSVLEAAAGHTGAGSAPADMAFSHNGKFLYARSGGSNTISAFRQQADGSLVSLGEVSVPPGATGLAAR